ncbi:MAG: purine-nucleoside phosphorylase [Caldisericaceae bacterium]
MEELKAFIQSHLHHNPEFAIVVGSGLGSILGEVDVKEAVKYKDIPKFPLSTVMGHKGEMVFGTLAGKSVVIFNGRVHYYEGYSMKDVTMNMQVAGMLGVKGVILSNASGAVNSMLNPGSIMIIKDHINLIFSDNPLRGEKGNEKFVNMTDAYDEEYRETLKKVALENNVQVFEGVYCAVPGPNFETIAELNFMSRIGADAVGMSTVPEVIMARYLGMKVLALSCVTDNVFMEGMVSHNQVLDVADRCGRVLADLVAKFIGAVK